MPVRVPDWFAATLPERSAAIAAAHSALSDGGLVLAACDSAYLLIAAADTIAGLAGLTKFSDPATHNLPAWLVSDPRALDRVALPLLPVHARLIRRLTPGPALLRIAVDDRALDALRPLIGVGPDAVDTAGAIWIRIPDDSPASALSHRRSPPLACVELSPKDSPDLGSAESACRQRGLEIASALGVPTLAQHRGASVLSLELGGQVKLLRPGAFEERYVRKLARLNILFVCTGNTCRSPMAQAIAESLLVQHGTNEQAAVSSAGVGAMHGAPASDETAQAVRSLGMIMGRHTSRPLTRELIAEADAVYTMTSGHKASVLAMDPGASGKVQTLDPAGVDVPDPIGMGQDTYTQTARRLKQLIERRLGELSV